MNEFEFFAVKYLSVVKVAKGCFAVDLWLFIRTLLFLSYNYKIYSTLCSVITKCCLLLWLQLVWGMFLMNIGEKICSK